jgi:uncharacterized membrane protein
VPVGEGHHSSLDWHFESNACRPADVALQPIMTRRGPRGGRIVMHRFAWVVQVGLGAYFMAIGVMHLVVPEGLPDQMAWMYDLPTWLHVASGTAEILGGLGLVLPAATRIHPHLTPMAAAGLATVMVLAALWHVPRGEMTNVVFTLVLSVVLAWLAWVRWRSHPITPRHRADVG